LILQIPFYFLEQEMTNYYTKAAFTIPCSEHQAQLALMVLEKLKESPGECITISLSSAAAEGASRSDVMIRHCMLNHPDPDDILWDFDARLYDTSENDGERPSGLMIYSDDTMSVDSAAIFTQAMLIAFDIDAFVDIQAAYTCDEEEIDTYGGFTQVVTKRFIHCDDAGQFITAEKTAYELREKYYACHFFESCNDHEYNTHFLMKCGSAVDAKDRLDFIMKTYRERSETREHTEDTAYFVGGALAKLCKMTEITPLEFSVMKKYLNVI
jgi:hypothetical protein